MTRSGSSRNELSAGGVVVRHSPDASRVLLIRDSYGKWGFPKGHVENGEAPDSAARREVAEETGLADLEVVALLDTVSWQFQWRRRRVHKTCHFYLMESRDGDPSPQRSEGITDCRWESFERAEDLIGYANAREVLRRAREHLAPRGRA